MKMMSMKDKFLFSVILPVYNAGIYLTDAVDSVIGQTVGFKENIQLIFINDGGSDNSGEICREYAGRYPDNIIYFEQKNAGVSAARNAGLKLAAGRYVNFMDADDKWSLDAFSAAAEFFASHPEVRIASAKILHFDARTAEDALNYIFETDTVADLRLKPDFVQVTIHNQWIERNLMGDMAFDTQMRIGEDSLFINQILLKEMRCGVLKTPVYWYRNRSEKNSVMDERISDPYFYNPILKLYLERIFEISRKLYGYEIPYAQYCVMYDLKWRIDLVPASSLSEDEITEYKNGIAALLALIDDEVILSQRGMNRNLKLSALALKRGISADEFCAGIKIIRNNVYHADPETGNMKRLWSAKDEKRVHVEILTQKAGKILLEGRLFSVLPQDQIQVSAEVDGKIYAAEIFRHSDPAVNGFMNANAGKWYGFKVSFPAGDFCFHLFLNGHEEKAWFDGGSVLSVGNGKLNFKDCADFTEEDFFVFENASKISKEEVMKSISGLDDMERISYIKNVYQKNYRERSYFRRVNLTKDNEIKEKEKLLAKYIRRNDRAADRLALEMENAQAAKKRNAELIKMKKQLVRENKILRSRINDIKQSAEWKTGLVITWLPRKIKKMRTKGNVQ